MSTAQPFSIFCYQITNRRLDDETLRFLESLLVCKDVKSFIELQSSLREFMRSESVSVLREIKTEKTVDQKLWILEFFVRAFALIGDIESCLALKYEALLFREIKSSKCQYLQVSYIEWLDFAEQLNHYGFYSTARQACENAILLCDQKDDGDDDDDVANANKRAGDERLQRLKDYAVQFAGSGSVQAQAAEYLNRKRVEKRNICSTLGNDTQLVGSILFRNGIKKRNVRQLHESQRVQKNIEL